MKYHIDKNGKPAVCRAEVRSCPLGGAESHFDSIEEAQAYADEQNKKEFGLIEAAQAKAVGESDVVEELYGEELDNLNYYDVIDKMKENHPDIYNNFIENLEIGDKKFTQTELIQTYHDYLETYPNDNISVYENLEVLSDYYEPSEELEAFYDEHNTIENKDYVEEEVVNKFKNDKSADWSFTEVVIDDEIRSNLQNMTDIKDCMIYASPDYAYKYNVKTNEIEQFNIHTLFAANLNERETALYVLDQHPNYDAYEPNYFIALAKTNKSIAELILKINKE